MIIRAVDLNVDMVDITAASEGAAVGIGSGACERDCSIGMCGLGTG